MVWLFLSIGMLSAEAGSPPPLPAMQDTSAARAPEQIDRRWSMETSLTAPIVRIYMVKAGYRFDLGSHLSLHVMPGLGHPVWAQHDWPRLEERSSRESPFDIVVFVPQVLIGWRF